MRVSLEVNGHSGYAEPGKDIICSAVSILTYTTAQLVCEMNAYGKLSEPPTVNLSDGDAVIEARCRDDNAFHEARKIIHFAKAGYSLLQNTYPEYIKFVINEA